MLVDSQRLGLYLGLILQGVESWIWSKECLGGESQNNLKPG